jgi:hypothetical protein
MVTYTVGIQEQAQWMVWQLSSLIIALRFHCLLSPVPITISIEHLGLA